MGSAVSERSIVVVANEQVSCDLSGDAVILQLKDGVYYGLDGVGGRGDLPDGGGGHSGGGENGEDGKRPHANRCGGCPGKPGG